MPYLPHSTYPSPLNSPISRITCKNPAKLPNHFCFFLKSLKLWTKMCLQRALLLVLPLSRVSSPSSKTCFLSLNPYSSTLPRLRMCPHYFIRIAFAIHAYLVSLWQFSPPFNTFSRLLLEWQANASAKTSQWLPGVHRRKLNLPRKTLKLPTTACKL